MRRAGSRAATRLAATLVAASLTVGVAEASEQVIAVATAYVGENLRRAQNVVIRISDGAIVSIEENAAVPVGAQAFPDAVAIPGLVDTHVYLMTDPGEPPEAGVAYTAERYALNGAAAAVATLCGGVTTVRDMGAPGQSAQALRNAVAARQLWGPMVVSVGPGLSAVGGHTDLTGLRADIADVLAPLVTDTCSGADDCAAHVRAQIRGGIDALRVSVTGGILSDQRGGFTEQFAAAEFDAIARTAATLGIPIAASGQGGPGLDRAILAPVATLEMAALLTDAQARAMATRGVALASGLGVFDTLRAGLAAGRYSDAVAEKARAVLPFDGRAVRRAQAAGARVVMASFAGLTAHGRNADELVALVDRGGLAPLDAVRAGTIDAARSLGLGAMTGSISKGRAADLLILRTDPALQGGRIGEPLAIYRRGERVPLALCEARARNPGP